MFEIREVLDIAIRLEKNGEMVYRNAIEKISKPELISLLKWMIDEEVRHAKWFSDLKENIETRSENPFAEEMGRELLSELIGEQSFSLGETDFSAVHDLNDLIGIFIEFEKDTVLFYEMLQPFIEDKQVLNQLKEIIAEENSHIGQLREFAENRETEAAYDD